MTDRQEERLIELLEQTGMLDSKSRCRIVAEELIANGVSVPSMPIGSKVYEIRAKGTRRYNGRKFDYALSSKLMFENAVGCGEELYVKEKLSTKTDSVRLNKSVFLTEEQAQKQIQRWLHNS